MNTSRVLCLLSIGNKHNDYIIAFKLKIKYFCSFKNFTNAFELS